MKVVEISKYSPMVRARKSYGTEWASADDVLVGRISREEYVSVEDKYVRALTAIAARFEPLFSHRVRAWKAEDEMLRQARLDDVFELGYTPVEGERLGLVQLGNVVRRCLRDVAWLEVVSRPRLIIHPSWDLRVFVACEDDIDECLSGARRDGLYVYPSKVVLETQREWAA